MSREELGYCIKKSGHVLYEEIEIVVSVQVGVKEFKVGITSASCAELLLVCSGDGQADRRGQAGVSGL